MKTDGHCLNKQGDDKTISENKESIAKISTELKGLRKEVSLCDGIEQRSSQISENLGLLNKEKEDERKEKSNSQHRQRHARSFEFNN